MLLISYVVVTQDMAYHCAFSFNLLMTDTDVINAAKKHIETKEERGKEEGNSKRVSHSVALQCADILTAVHT
jgi:hypothetical protein